MKRLLLVLALLSCQTPTSPDVTPFNTLIGIGSHGQPSGPPEAETIRALGMRFVRITYYTQQTSEQYDADFRLRTDLLKSQGLDVLVVVHDFARRTPHFIASTMAGVAYRFPRLAFQIGNEWDAEGMTGETYAHIMSATVPAMQYSSRGVQIVGMGLATTEGHQWVPKHGEPWTVRFTKEYLAYSGPLLDAWCIHAYGIPLGTSVDVRVQATQQALKYRMPLWITEAGVDREGVESAYKKKGVDLYHIDSVQALESLRAVIEAKKLGVDRLYFYQLFTGDDDGFGWYNTAGKPRRVVALVSPAIVK